MKKVAALVLPLLLVLSLALVACGKTGSTSGGGGGGGNSVTMGQADFNPTTVSVKAGDPVKFTTSSDGATHILCIGENGQCTANATGPTDFTQQGGVTINPGESKTETFSTAGTYHVTCTVHPQMNMTVTVS